MLLPIGEMVAALQSPQRPYFRVAFELFASSDRQSIAMYPKTLAGLIAESDGSAEDLKKVEEFARKFYLDKPVANLTSRFATHSERYFQAKIYFERSMLVRGIANGLIFYDDAALRVDIGYGPKEFMALFPDFFGYGGFFADKFLGSVSFFNQDSCQLFIKKNMDEDYRKSLDAERVRIYASAQTEFARTLTPRTKVTVAEPTEFNEEDFIRECYGINRGLVVGEEHHHKSPKQFLVDNMWLLKSQGVTTLYIEHLLHDCHQRLLDEYFSSVSSAPIPKELELYLNYLDSGNSLSGSATFTAVVKEAKKYQIRTVAIDSEATYSQGVLTSLSELHNDNGSASKKRYTAMNMATLERFRQYNDGNQYVVFVGSAHVSTCAGVPGVSELLCCPNIVVSDLKAGMEESVEQDVDFECKGLHFDTLYHRDQASKRQVIKDTTYTHERACASESGLFSHKYPASVLHHEKGAEKIYASTGYDAREQKSQFRN